MSRQRNFNIDRRVNKPDLRNTESVRDDETFNRSSQVRRDDDVVVTPKRTVYDIDFALKWFIEIQYNQK